MIEYRPFRNSDLPQLVQLWHDCGLGRGAASGFRYEAFDRLVIAQHYFDPKGLIVACEGTRPIGFVHAGFRSNDLESWINRTMGAICVVMVEPSHRRQGIGRELVSRAEAYLREMGALSVQAGPSPPCDPFYIGLYGGAQLSGFLDSDTAAAPFLAALGYQPAQSFAVLQRSLIVGDPMSFRLSMIRRKMDPFIFALPENPTWWWFARYGRLENVRFRLMPKGGGPEVAAATVSGLDLYVDTWNQRAIGVADLEVNDDSRRQGHGQALLIEIIRRMRQEQVALAEAHIAEDNPGALATFKSVGFQQVDRGVVYRKS